MNVQELIAELTLSPKKFTAIGFGTVCVALIHPSNFDAVLLLQGEKKKVAREPSASHPSSLPTGENILEDHKKTVGVSEIIDPILERGLSADFVHASLLDSAVIDSPQTIKLDAETEWRFVAARLTKRIPGISLDRLCTEGVNTLGTERAETVTSGIAEWIFQLHHKVGAQMSALIDPTAFRKIAGKQTSSFKSTTSYRYFGKKNPQNLRELKDQLAQTDSTSDERLRNISSNLATTDINIADICELADLLKERVDAILAQDRISMTLTHGDLHIGNFLVDPQSLRVHGVCDWMKAMLDHPGMDFIRLTSCPGLMPKVFEKYQEKEAGHKTETPVNKEFVYAFSTLYAFHWLIKEAEKSNGCFQQFHTSIVEQVEELARMNPAIYGQAEQKFSKNTSARALMTEYNRPQAASAAL
ncbi:MAG: phosphotransferase [Alphaproteobacteria bacterium]